MYRYALGYMGQGCAYNFMSAYFVLFLTNCVGVHSGLAGTISSLALMVEVAAGMIFGNLSDKCASKLGRRRPFILTAAIAVPIILVLVFHTIDASPTVTFIYYLVFAMAFRVFFSCFEIPNGAFGSEIATGYDERTRLRTACRWTSIVGNGISAVVPLLILDFFESDQETGWQLVGIVTACVTLTAWMGSFILTKPYGIPYGGEKVHRKRSSVLFEIGKNYMELFKLKPMKLLIVYKGAFACAFALYNIATLYFLQYALGLSKAYSSYVNGFTIVVFFIMTPLVNKMALRQGKANQQKYTLLTASVIGVAVYLTAPNSIVGGVIYIGVFAAVQTGFWQLSNAIFYDVIEVDEYVNRKRRGGDIMSLVSVLGTLVTAIMVQLFGILLDVSGFDPAAQVQADSVISFLDAGYILVPSICCFVGFLALKAFPINNKTFSSLQKAIQLRDKGENYDQYMDDVNKVIN